MLSPASKLQKIKTFDQLIEYLQDELDWPIDSQNFDDLTFDYEPEELGIEPKLAVKIKEIKQLRPLVDNQPWGIFFISFEPKQLPIVVLRRILRSLVVKKKASAARSDQATWNCNDLLFISSYGETDRREITFAHFSEPENNSIGDLPTLKVLGWDDDDTKLKMDNVTNILTTILQWPRNRDARENWRKSWSQAFILRPKEIVKTAKDLAVKLADLARSIRERAKTIIAVESKYGPLRQLHSSFKTYLIHDLSEEDFADTYAQTISYGLLAARFSTASNITTGNLATMVPITNPFLKEMLGTFLRVGGRKGLIDFDELGIQDVVDLLNSQDTHMQSILRDFGNKTLQEDPVVHFYELFLKQYDHVRKIQRGVFYTPQPVVAYIVRSINEILINKFGLPDGLASTTTWAQMIQSRPYLQLPTGISLNDPFVQILDIAAGTGTFLVAVIDLVYETLSAKWTRNGCSKLEIDMLWNEYVPQHLLPRLYGFELMMAPYAIAHMKIGLKLLETGYNFHHDHRVQFFLTNTLESPDPDGNQPSFSECTDIIANEAAAVQLLKARRGFTVILGNPPYARLSANLGIDSRLLVNRYKFIDGKRLAERGALQLEKNLQDDYVKFLAFSEDCINSANTGILGMICNQGFVENPTLRGVRWSLINTFTDLWVLDLHGNVNRGHEGQNGSLDQNVFDIKDAGVAIVIGAKSSPHDKPLSAIHKSDIVGDRELYKYPFLLSNTVLTTPWNIVNVNPDLFLFRIVGEDGTSEYTSWPKLTEIFSLHSIGIVTARDAYVIDFDQQPVIKRAEAFRDSLLDDHQTCRTLDISIKKGWNIALARKRIKKLDNLSEYIRPILYRPFDFRYIFYHESLIWGMAWPVMQHLVDGGNRALITSRIQTTEKFDAVFTSEHISEIKCAESTRSSTVFPLFIRPRHDNNTSHCLISKNKNNFTAGFLALIEKLFGFELGQQQAANSNLDEWAIFDYIYAILHSPTYRRRYVGYLKIDYPRVPFTFNLLLFKELATLGSQLVDIHLMKSETLEKLLTSMRGNFESTPVSRIHYSNDTVWISDRKETGFHGVTTDVWNFRIGGYQVCQKWLKDRKGRTLSTEEIVHYQRIVVALNETIRIMSEIDEVIESYGGWPGAFS